VKQVALRRVASVRVSNVNKHSVDTEPAVRLCNYTDVYYQPTIHRGLDFMRATATREQVRSFALEVGDTVMTKDSETASDIGVSTHVAETVDDLVCGYHLAILRPGPDVHAKYLTWAVRAGAARHHLATSATGMTRMGLTYDAINSTPIPDIPFSDQQRIADFLDAQVLRIDAAIASRHRQQVLVAESEASRAAGAFSRITGRIRLSRLLRTSAVGVVVNPSSYFVDDGVPFIHGYNVRDGWFDLRDLKRMSAESSRSLPRSELQCGDVLVVRAGYPGRAAVVTEDLVGGNCASVLVLRCGVELLPAYLAAFLNSPLGKAQVSAAQYGAAQGVVNLGDVLSFQIPHTSVAAQRTLIGRLQRITEATRQVRATLNDSISLLTEYKQALITAAVTGEFDVTAATGRGMPGADA